MASFRVLALIASATALTATAACSPPSPETAEARPAAPARLPPCPAEQLSCGLQKPVRSDGVTPFENADMGLKAVFPEGSQVCLTRSGDAPRGFFASYAAGPAACEEPPRRPPRFITLNSAYNALAYPTLEAAAPDCRPLPDALRGRLGAPLAFPGQRSLVCDTTTREGTIEVTVNAMTGRRSDDGSPEARAPTTGYFAVFGTTPDHLDEDLARFRRVLATTEITGARVG